MGLEDWGGRHRESGVRLGRGGERKSSAPESASVSLT